MIAAIEPFPSVDYARRLDELLLRCLAKVSPREFPGADGLTIDGVLCTYDALAARGSVPSREELRRTLRKPPGNC